MDRSLVFLCQPRSCVLTPVKICWLPGGLGFAQTLLHWPHVVNMAAATAELDYGPLPPEWWLFFLRHKMGRCVCSLSDAPKYLGCFSCHTLSILYILLLGISHIHSMGWVEKQLALCLMPKLPCQLIAVHPRIICKLSESLCWGGGSLSSSRTS